MGGTKGRNMIRVLFPFLPKWGERDRQLVFFPKWTEILGEKWTETLPVFLYIFPSLLIFFHQAHPFTSPNGPFDRVSLINKQYANAI